MAKITALEIFGFILLLASIALFAVSEATSFWYIINQADRDSYYGFWQFCNKTFSDQQTTCAEIEWQFYSADDFFITWQLTACKVLFMASNAFVVIGLVCLLLSLLIDVRGSTVVAEGCMYLLAGVSSLFGCGLFTIYPDSDDESRMVSNLWNGYGYSYILGWCAAGCIFFAVIIFILVGSKLNFSAAVAPSVVYVNQPNDEDEDQQVQPQQPPQVVYIQQ